jgi:hypothetical protein
MAQVRSITVPSSVLPFRSTVVASRDFVRRVIHYTGWIRDRRGLIELMAKPLRLAIAALQAPWSVASIPLSESSAGAMRSR